ncbi:unnamed protein product [Nesidiocoris tenuis]|uniref:Integrase catalytic domain-containing protein n=1 Tax=Nesidiocoris tenuis TaxID=355587 RepID=A0A6H5GC51_9HEMI|nr:unnamed protein product [Nesidiocoris tenuis]
MNLYVTLHGKLERSMVGLWSAVALREKKLNFSSVKNIKNSLCKFQNSPKIKKRYIFGIQTSAREVMYVLHCRGRSSTNRFSANVARIGLPRQKIVFAKTDSEVISTAMKWYKLGDFRLNYEILGVCKYIDLIYLDLGIMLNSTSAYLSCARVKLLSERGIILEKISPGRAPTGNFSEIYIEKLTRVEEIGRQGRIVRKGETRFSIFQAPQDHGSVAIHDEPFISIAACPMGTNRGNGTATRQSVGPWLSKCGFLLTSIVDHVVPIPQLSDTDHDPLDFLRGLLDHCLLFRAGQLKEPPILYRAEHLESFFAAFDPLKTELITLQQYHNGFLLVEWPEGILPVRGTFHGQLFFPPRMKILLPTTPTTGNCSGIQGTARMEILLVLCKSKWPKLQQNICDVLIRFRLHNVCLVADVKQMYRCIGVASADQDQQRIFWRFSPADSLSEFRLTTVTYGNAAAPFLALRTMKQLVYDEGSQFPMAAKALLNNTFVDDTCISVPTVHDALKLQAELVALLAKGKFSLKKWLSNRPQLLKNIPEEDRAMKTEILSFRGDDGLDPGTNILGLSWNPATDQFSFKIEPLKEMIVTKRTILSEVSRLYDPLGFLCPVTFYGKWLIPHLWSSGLGWDETPSEEIVIKWKQYHSELPLLSQVQIPRCVELDSAVSVQLHGFCDSSQRGYAGVVYLRNINKNGKITCSLLVAKSKVAPLKRISLPRLELCGAVLVTDLLHYAKEMLKDHVSIQSTVVWCDSMVSLQWIKASPHKWKTFIANRVSQIHERLAPDCFRYVPSASNPSDIASRGALPMQFLSDRSWLSGPDWLIGPPEKWPKVPPLLKSEEVMAEAQIVSLPLNSEITPIESWLENYSSFTSLKRHTAFLLRYFKYLRDPHADSLLTGGLTTDELKLAVIRLVRVVQSQVFSSEIKLLSEGKLIASKFRKLNPFLDDDSIIRVGGRLKHAPIPSDQKHPMLLPKAHHFTHLVVDHFHLKYLHAGPLLVQSLIRAEFWIVNSREVIRNRLSRCVTCFKTKPKEQEHLMGDLPTSRLEPISAFYRCSCDYGGPYRIKASSLRNAKVTKAYICLFVCFTTRAIHLELVSDLTTDAFIAALRRFVGRRGSVSEIQSDCGTNFVGAKHKLEDWSKFVSSKQHNSQVEKCLAEEGITWKLCAPGSPHLNGLAEAGIKSIKTHLTKVIGEQTLTYEEFYTILTQIEAVVNSRPITQVSSDPNDLQALTPGHFLMQRPAFALVGPEPENLNITKRWKLVQKLLHSFWDRWRKDYLGGLQTRSKWTKEFNNLKVDDLVIMKEPNLSPSQWKMARITKVLPGEDGIVRVAEVKTAQGTFTRSLGAIDRPQRIDRPRRIDSCEYVVQEPLTTQVDTFPICFQPSRTVDVAEVQPATVHRASRHSVLEGLIETSGRDDEMGRPDKSGHRGAVLLKVVPLFWNDLYNLTGLEVVRV